MATLRQLYDPQTGTHYLLDSTALVFKVSSDQVSRQTRVKPYFAEILAALFAKHPQPVSYQEIANILKSRSLACPDETRLHRKVSELRVFLVNFAPGLENLLCNTRGIGYSLPLHFKDPSLSEGSNHHRGGGNKKIQDVMTCFEEYANESIKLSQKCSIIKMDHGFILQRKPVHSEVERLLENYELQKKKLYSELRLHSADFIHIRLEFILSKLKTYLGLARMSEFSITKALWLEWHEAEVKQVLDELICQVQQV